MSKTVLKPCFRCGGEAKAYVGWDGAFVRCSKCRIGTTPSHQKDVTVRAWNRRVNYAS